MNTAEQERTARADHEILLVNLAAAQDESTRLFIELLLQKSLFHIRGLMLAQAIDLCSVPDCLSEGREIRNGKQWCAGTLPNSETPRRL
jgi:hypothetical protein